VSGYYPEQLFEAGFTDLISVIPPGAQLTPKSKLSASSAGKAPGHRTQSGLWCGYPWQKAEHTLEDVRRWAGWGGNVGLRADRFPAVDIDTMDAGLAGIIEDCAVAILGKAPVRYGRRPKRLLVYRTAEPFGRMRLLIERAGEQHLVEVLGAGQQFVVHGLHPATMQPYEWTDDLRSWGILGLTAITREKADHFLTELAGLVGMLGAWNVRRVGDGRVNERSAAAQGDLLAPSIEALAEAVALIPNRDDVFPTRDDYIRIGYAIRAAAGEADAEQGYDIFAAWAGSRAADGRVAGNPDTWRTDWRRMLPPYSVGWNFLADLARQYGYDTAGLEFDVIADAPPPRADIVEAPEYSDQWLADKVVAARAGELRFVPLTGTWIVWDGARWQPDAELMAEEIVIQELRRIADRLSRTGATPEEKKANHGRAIMLCSAGKATSVRTLMQSNRSVAVSTQSLDHDPWVLNTPAGIIDLKTGELLPPNPDALCTKSTSVPAAFGAAAPEWRRFLAETTNHDQELIDHLQRVAGYALTGVTREQNLTFIYGKGGNGKGTFLNVLTGILADYWRSASMDTFTASTSDKHTTDIAMLVGARLVTASETQAGKRWDDQKVKALTGGDPITARFMRQDNFTYKPQFKLLFIGNHKPEIRDVDDAMRRRIQMVPFKHKPAVVDNQLEDKLKLEWPAIFAWMVEGCLKWQSRGLLPLPHAVAKLTDEYFEGEDALGRWINECCTVGDDERAYSTELYDSWRAWARQNGEYEGSMKRLTGALKTRNIEQWQDSTTRRRGFAGISVNRLDFETLT
jgi:P4 family phage/plasmid primase-like protien